MSAVTACLLAARPTERYPGSTLPGTADFALNLHLPASRRYVLHQPRPPAHLTARLQRCSRRCDGLPSACSGTLRGPSARRRTPVY